MQISHIMHCFTFCWPIIFGSIRTSRNANIRLSVCSIKTCLSSQNSPFSLRTVSVQCQVTLRSFSSYFIGQTEPKILRLVRLDLHSIRTNREPMELYKQPSQVPTSSTKIWAPQNNLCNVWLIWDLVWTWILD